MIRINKWVIINFSYRKDFWSFLFSLFFRVKIVWRKKSKKSLPNYRHNFFHSHSAWWWWEKENIIKFPKGSRHKIWSIIFKLIQNIEKQSYFSICKYYALKEISDWRFEKERKGEEAPRAVTILKMLFFELKFYIYLIIKWLQVDLNTQKKIQIYFLEISDLC